MASPFFLKNLVRSKIAETLACEMFKEIPRFIVVPFGNEYILSDILKMDKDEQLQTYTEQIHQRPDFSIIDTETGSHFLTEVKYRENPTPALILTVAQELYAMWPTAYLCLVTPIGFFFDSCTEIIAHEGDIALTDTGIIPASIQEKYVKIVQEVVRLKTE